MVSVRVIFLGVFIFILVFYVLGAFLIKRLFHSRLLDIYERDEKYSTDYYVQYEKSLVCLKTLRDVQRTLLFDCLSRVL